MDEETRIKLVGVGDLVKRWGYTKQGIHRRIKLDKKFPIPLAKINNKILVFDFKDVLEYEELRKGVYMGDGFKQYLQPNIGRCTSSVNMHTYEEWAIMEQSEKDKHK